MRGQLRTGLRLGGGPVALAGRVPVANDQVDRRSQERDEQGDEDEKGCIHGTDQFVVQGSGSGFSAAFDGSRRVRQLFESSGGEQFIGQVHAGGFQAGQAARAVAGGVELADGRARGIDARLLEAEDLFEHVFAVLRCRRSRRPA